MHINELTELAKKALQVPPDLSYYLFLASGKQMLRSDLALSDYATAIGGADCAELFLAPSGRGPPAGHEEDDDAEEDLPNAARPPVTKASKAAAEAGSSGDAGATTASRRYLPP